MTEQDQLVYQFQVLNAQLQQMHQYLAEMQTQVMQLEALQQHLSLLSTSEGGESLLPLSSGVFVKGSLAKVDSVVMQVGAGVCVEKTVSEAQETITGQITQLAEVIAQVEAEIAKVSSQMQNLFGQ